jgi:hypothetical protein
MWNGLLFFVGCYFFKTRDTFSMRGSYQPILVTQGIPPTALYSFGRLKAKTSDHILLLLYCYFSGS